MENSNPSIFIDINHIFEEQEESSTQNIEHDIELNLKRAKSILASVKTTSATQYEIENFENRINNLNEFFLFFKTLKNDSNTLPAKLNEIKFVEYLVIKKLNNLMNEKCDLNFNILFNRISSPLSSGLVKFQTNSLLSVLNEYEYEEGLSQKLNDKEFKPIQLLRIKSISMENTLSNNNFINKNGCLEQLCIVYQFAVNETLQLPTLLNKNTDSLMSRRSPRSKSQTKQPSTISKRSSSADQQTLKQRRLKLDNRGISLKYFF